MSQRVMGSAVLTAMPLLYLLKRRRWVTPLGPLAITPSRIESKFVQDGLGFRISGTCAAPAVAMAGTGHLAGIATVAGLFAGILALDAWRSRAADTGVARHDDAATSGTATTEAPAGTVFGL